jgi:hypothetical protein
MSARLTVCFVSRSRARLHVNARMQAVRQTLRQARNMSPMVRETCRPGQVSLTRFPGGKRQLAAMA